MTTHTPGPWIAEPATKAFTVHTMRGATVARVGGSSYGTPHEQRYADARLIAAAPDMLAALKSALSDARPSACRTYWRYSEDGESSELVREETWPDWVAAARAAIDRVTGGGDA